MLRTLIATGLLLAIPIGSFAQSTTGTSSSVDYAPCAHITDATERYQCRRFEAMSHVRAAYDEFRQYSRPTIIAIQKQYGKDLKKIYLDYAPLSSSERQKYVDDLKNNRLAAYLEWYAQEQELLVARRNLRMLTRLPNNKELRMELIRKKGAFQNTKSNVKKTRRTIVEEQIEFMRSFREGK
ncbi:MAG: hypothetical protein ABIA92_03375 [Patescibacteria group bacterium]